MRRAPRPPVVVDTLLDDPRVIDDIVERAGPYWTVQRYLRNLSEMAALSEAGRRQDAGAEAPMFIAPWFRGDLLAEALDPEAGAQVELLLTHPRLLAAAAEVFPGASFVPELLYLNLNPPMPQVDPGHTDVPAFRGIDRRSVPVWLLVTMLRSCLFERWYVPTVTAVSWYYQGEGGGFRYWPAGPDEAPVDRPCVSNSAVVGDNDRMFHCVHQVGAPGTKIRMTRGLTLGSTLAREGDHFHIDEAGARLASFPAESVRVSVSWKARVYADEAARRMHEAGEDSLDLATVEAVFVDDLRRRGVEVAPPEDLLRDVRFMNALTSTYRVSPSRF